MFSKKLIAAVSLAMLSSVGYADCAITDIKQFAEMVATAHKQEALAAIDRKYFGKKPFEVVIENSLGEGDQFERTNVTSFTEAANWLKKRQSEGFPSPDIRKLVNCENGVCLFDFFEGINHNTLYLKEIHYNGTLKCAELKLIQFLDGN